MGLRKVGLMSNTVPTCGVCGDGGHGIQFPLFPKTEGKTFGTICVGCDDKEGESK